MVDSVWLLKGTLPWVFASQPWAGTARDGNSDWGRTACRKEVDCKREKQNTNIYKS